MTVARGEENQFNYGGQTVTDMGQPTEFQPGRAYDAFTIPFDGTNLVWKLGSRTSTANSASETDESCAGMPAVSSLVKAYAFGSDGYVPQGPADQAAGYVKVVQNGANFTYDAEQGHGYTDVQSIDGSINNRGQISCEAYDQFIGVKYGGAITYRIDVPNGTYRFVAAGGDARYGGHNTTITLRDGTDGQSVTLVDNATLQTKQYYTVGFDGRTPQSCPEGDFLALTESPHLVVTAGYIEVVQSTTGTGGDLCLLEVWQSK